VYSVATLVAPGLRAGILYPILGLLMHRFSAAVIAAVSTVALAQIAFAADLPRKAPAYTPPPPVYNWTGFYVGANIGGGWGRRDVTYAPNDPVAGDLFTPGHSFETPRSPSFDVSGVIGGLQLGYNYQFARNWLVGFETDFDWSGMKGSATTIFDSNTLSTTVDEHIKWFGTVRARFGYLPMDNLLAFVTGGFAYGRVEHSASFTNLSTAFSVNNGAPLGATIGFDCLDFSTCFAGSSSNIATGWTLGGGLEYALWQQWTLKAEYLYVSLESKSVTETALFSGCSCAPASLNADFSRTNFNVARVGFNYRFH
jgi:outer membrane immunogenic protein